MDVHVYSLYYLIYLSDGGRLIKSETLSFSQIKSQHFNFTISETKANHLDFTFHITKQDATRAGLCWRLQL